MVVETELAHINEFWTVWGGLLGALLGISLTLVVGAFTIGTFANDEKLKSWAKSELFEVFYSVIIVVIMIMLINPANNGSSMINDFSKTLMGIQDSKTTQAVIAVQGDKDTCSRNIKDGKLYELVDICGNSGAVTDESSVYSKTQACHVRLGVFFLREIFDETRDYAYTIYISYIRTSMAAEFGINLETPLFMGGMISINPLKGFYTMGNKIKDMVFDWSIKLMTLLKFQEVILLFIATAIFPVFFVLGTLLRAFPLTRRLGGLLMGIALSLYFVFPSFYAFGGLIIIKIKADADVKAAWDATGNLENRGIQWIPIANTMYLDGNIPVLGGSSEISAKEYRDQLARLSCYKDNDIQEIFNTKSITDSNNKVESVSFNFDFNKAQPPKDDNAARAQGESITAKVTQWLTQLTKFTVIDRFTEQSWKRGGALDSMAKLTFWAVFFSLLSVISTIGAIRSLSATFGGDIEIAGLTRLI